MTVYAASVEIDITPPIGVAMAGYTARTEASIGIHDPLKTQVLLLNTRNASALIITMDLLAVQSQFSKRLRTLLGKVTGIPENHIMLACSHTHSGPQGFNLDDKIIMENRDDALQDMTIRKICGACTWVKTLLQPVKLSLGYSFGDGVGLNRNDPLKGLADQQVSVLRIDDVKGNPIAVLYNYGCHPTVMGSDNLLISADYVGAARKVLNNVFPDTVFHFTNSAAGDVSTRFTRRSATFDEVTRIGQIMAGVVFQAMNTAEAFETEDIQACVASVNLPFKDFPSIEETKEIIKALKVERNQMQQKHAPAAELRKVITKIEGAETLLPQIKQFKGSEKFQASIQKIQIGPLSLIGVPGEPFSKTFLDIKDQTKPAKVILIGYANDCLGYFPESTTGLSNTYENFASPFSSAAALNIKNLAIDMIKEEK